MYTICHFPDDSDNDTDEEQQPSLGSPNTNTME
jgi:hypothetical protein